jgi:glucosamine-6-phosphate deaminase
MIDRQIHPDPSSMGQAAAAAAADAIGDAIAQRGGARIIVATGTSQFEVLAALTARQDIDWTKVDGFHLDEYIGLGPDHRASFCRYLRERFVSHVPIRHFAYLDGRQKAEDLVQSVGMLLTAAPIDVALVGIGENAHLAFNDPPADFLTRDPYKIVPLDHACRMQQVGEGWFNSIDDVPTHAISMTIQQILQSRRIICSVPDARKAVAVERSLCGPVTPMVPASILQQHPAVQLFLDPHAAKRLPAP